MTATVHFLLLLLLTSLHNQIIPTASQHAPYIPNYRMIGGDVPPKGRYPYIVSLTYFGAHFCGGSMIAPDIVLSAAHCGGYSSTVEIGRFDRKEGTLLDETVVESLLADAKDGVIILSDTEYYESIDVEYELKHPSYNEPVQVDNDFMILKLSRPTMVPNFPLAKLNTDPDIPDEMGTELLTMGWGDTDPDPNVNTPSDILLGSTVNYVPNNECRAIEGKHTDPDKGTMFVSFRPMITENMMCAADMPDGEISGDDQFAEQDTCQGDSGSPMILSGARRGSWETDLQVGVVSWGMGCASPTFPGVYARVSAQYEWINEMVCTHSYDPPESFGCEQADNGDSGPSSKPKPPKPADAGGDNAYVTVEIRLDDEPKEFSWVMSTLNGGGYSSNQLISSMPTGYYHGYSNFTFQHMVQVKPDQFYRMSLRDKSGQGLWGYVAVYRGSVATTGNLIMYENSFSGDGQGKLRSDYGFYSGKATDTESFLSLAINFDKYPMDTWWRLENIKEGIIIAQRPRGWYNERFELMSVVEIIPIFGKEHPSSESPYRLTVGDSYPCLHDETETCGDGMCCDYGNGGYFLFEGDVSDEILLATGGKFELKDTKVVQPWSGKSIAMS